MSVDVVQSVVLQIEVISMSLCTFIDRSESGFAPWFYFPTLMPTQVAFTFMQSEKERERERRVEVDSFFSSSFSPYLPLLLPE